MSRLRAAVAKQAAEMTTLQKELSEADANERIVLQHLAQVNEVLSNVENVSENHYEAGLHEDKLQSRIDIMEAQVAFYMKRAEEQSSGDEVDTLKEQLVRR